MYVLRYSLIQYKECTTLNMVHCTNHGITVDNDSKMTDATLPLKSTSTCVASGKELTIMKLSFSRQRARHNPSQQFDCQERSCYIKAHIILPFKIMSSANTGLR